MIGSIVFRADEAFCGQKLRSVLNAYRSAS